MTNNLKIIISVRGGELTFFAVFICVCLCPAMELKLGMRAGEGPQGSRAYFRSDPLKVKGYSGVRDDLWLPNLARRIPEKGVKHCQG